MTDKEKEVIKFLYNLRATIDESIMLFDEGINVRCGKETIKQITTVLNLIQTQQAEIEKKDNIIDKKDKQIEYMANFINDNTPYTKDTRILENERGVRNTKYTEKYFERKVENGN